MPFNDDKFSAPATNGEVAGIAIYTALGLSHLGAAVEAVKNGGDPTKSLNELKVITRKLEGKFDELTGWTSE